MQNTPAAVAIAILYQHNTFLMQLRDNIPSIVYPGYWGFFGGHIEVGESPETALRRELLEEIEYAATELSFFGHYGDQKVTRHVFHGPLTVGLEELVLNEGWDLALLSPTHIRQGKHYSAKAGEERPLAPIHQRILCDFFIHLGQ